MSLPARATSARPSGITVSGSGAGPLTEYRRLCSRKITGFSSRIDALSRPLASAGDDGKAIFRPGTPWNQVACVWEWIAPKRPPPPTAERTTIGTLRCSLDRYQYLADWLTSESMDSPMKSPNMISMIGRSPVTAAPNAAPVIASSEIGVSNTREAPICSWTPGVTANTPPCSAAMSSPKNTTEASRSISSMIASRIATRNSS